ncbi:MAG TPA: hypothetical protein VGG39_37705 [Polyangiaceae bacterium]|jgi:hypothetical protein
MHQNQPQEHRLTTWRNPTRQEMRVDVHDSPGRFKRFTFPPGKEVQVPSEFDRAIHDIRDGVIVGGLAPLLERAIGDETLHPALDPEVAATKAAEEEAERAVLAKKAADEVLAQTRAPRRPGG